jgi:hypothetical protein
VIRAMNRNSGVAIAIPVIYQRRSAKLRFSN